MQAFSNQRKDFMSTGYVDMPRDTLGVVQGHRTLLISRDLTCYDRKAKRFLTIVREQHRHPYVVVERKRYKVKLLLAAAFLTPPLGYDLHRDLDKLDVEQKDGDKNNLELDNLRWVCKPDVKYLLNAPNLMDRLIVVPSHPHLAVNRRGQVAALNRMRIQPVTIAHDRPIVRDKFGGSIAVAKLLAEVFVKDFPQGKSLDDLDDLFVIHKDGDRLNTDVDNLRWGSSTSVNFPDVLASGEFKQTVSQPLLAISRDGVVINLVTGREINKSISTQGYFTIRTSFSGENKLYWHHRLVAEVFVAPPPGMTIEQCITSLVINHLNSNPQDNRPENLEWTTQALNITHGYRAGRHDKTTRVTVTDLATKTSRTYATMRGACLDNGIAYSLVQSNFYKGAEEVTYNGLQVKKTA